MEIIKLSTPRNKKYLEYIREQPCVICGSEFTVAHHCYNSGMKLKGSDLRVLPLCVNCHTFGKYSAHSMGREQFEKHHNIDIDKLIIGFLEKYIEEKT